jgi:molybdate transport system permease protein
MENNLHATAGGRPTPARRPRRSKSDVPFLVGLSLLGGSYLVLIVLTLAADVAFVVAEGWHDVGALLLTEDVRYATRLSLVSSCVTTILALWVAIPIGYLLSRFHFRGKALLDAVLDIPIVLPPLVIGVSLLILFTRAPGTWLDAAFVWLATAVFAGINAAAGTQLEPPSGFAYAIPGVILAQFMVAAAFGVRTMRTAFDEITPRKEQVAMTLGCSRGQAFWHVVLPEARGGVLAAATITWARAIGEFGPILVFAGATPKRTQVLATSIFLQMSVGDLQGAVAMSLVMVLMAVAVLVVVRVLVHRELGGRTVPD